MSIIFKSNDGKEIRFEKANPYHAPDGKFTTKGGGRSVGATASGTTSGSKGPNGGPAPDGADPYEYRSKHVDKKNRAKFDAVDEILTEGMSTGSKKADNFINLQFNRFCRYGEDQYLNEAAGKLYEYTGDPRFK